MTDTIRKPFSLERINCELPPFYNLALPYDGDAREHVSFRHGELTAHNQSIARYKILSEFKKFTRKCMRRIPAHARLQKVTYGSSRGFPVAILPDNSEIITINDLNDGYKIHFAWIIENGGEHE